MKSKHLGGVSPAALLTLLILSAAVGFLHVCPQENSLPQRTPSGEQSISKEGQFWSERLKVSVPYWIYLPPRNNPKGKLPVVYFLHGLGESHLWFQYLGGKSLLEKRHLEGGAPFALVALMGKVGEHNFYWVDEARGDLPGSRLPANSPLKHPVPWASMLIRELIPAIEEQHQIGGSQNLRAIAGVSMGSAGAFQLALNFPGTFQCVAGHSLVLRTAESALRDFPNQFGSVDQFRKRDPLSLIKAIPSRYAAPFQRTWIDLGGAESSERLTQAAAFRKELLRLGFPSRDLDAGERDPRGGHNQDYWQGHLPEWLDWYGSCFQ